MECCGFKALNSEGKIFEFEELNLAISLQKNYYFYVRSFSIKSYLVIDRNDLPSKFSNQFEAKKGASDQRKTVVCNSCHETLLNHLFEVAIYPKI